MKFAVIFDMDGVLVDSADAHFRSWRMLAEEEGLSMTRQQFDETFGRPSRDIVRLHFGRNLIPSYKPEFAELREAVAASAATA